MAFLLTISFADRSPASQTATADIDSLSLLQVLNGEATGDQFGISVAGAGDVNGDGFADLLVGANAHDGGGSAAGKAYIYFGGESFAATPDWTYQGTGGDFLGSAVAGVGDVNGDGYDDILVGAPFADDLGVNAGKAILFLGGNPMDQIPDLIFHGEISLDQFGSEVSGLGDINNDGYEDWAIGVFKADSGAQENIGKIHVYFGALALDTIADLTILGKSNGERFGSAVAGCSRFNGDAYDDFVVGAYSYDGSSLTNTGRAYVFYGGAPPDTVADLVLTGENAHDFFAYSVAGAGDVNGDGFGDVIVGAKGYDFGAFTDAGKVYLYLGGNPPNNVADFVSMANQNNNDEYGNAVAGAGDLDGDGRAEFLIGADHAQAAGTNSGRAYLHMGAQIPPFPIDTIFDGLASEFRLGNDLAALGAIAEDLFGAFAIGAMGYSGSTGRVYVYGSIDTSSATNQAPILDPIGSKQVAEGGHLEFRVSGSDPDGTIPQLSAIDLPSNASFHDSLNGAAGFFFDPVAGQTGIYNVIFIAGDGALADSETVKITVHDGNCFCAYQCDYDEDDFLTALDLGVLIDVLFAGQPEEQDPTCPTSRGDFDCDGFPTALDLGGLIDHLFAGQSGPCDPCGS